MSRSVVHLRWGIDDFEDSFRTGKCGLDRVVHIRKLTQRLDKVLGVGNESRNHADRHETLKCQISTQTHEHDDEEITEYIGERHQHEGVGVGIDTRRIHFLVAGAEAFDGNIRCGGRL